MSTRTVRVRIAVAVESDGYWEATGSDVIGDEGAIMDLAHGKTSGPFALHWVEADLPIPEALTVQGVVTPGGE